MKFLIPLALFVAVLLWYAIQGRDWLKTKPWAEGFFAWIEPIEIVLFKKSPTILFARLKIVTGLALTALTQVGAINLTPIMPFVPEKYQSWVNFAINSIPLAISLIGMADEWLRNRTTRPVELVAIADKDVTPAVADIIAKADEVKTEAPVVVAQAKAA